MHTLRLAYAFEFLIAVIAVYVLWSQVGGQSHLDLMPWYFKLGLGVGAALAAVKATDSAVSQDHAWNGQTLKWFGILMILLLGCGLASYYCHLYLEDNGDDQPGDNSAVGRLLQESPVIYSSADAQALGCTSEVGDRPFFGSRVLADAPSASRASLRRAG